jgi:fructose-1,6-bisphosphatase I
MGSEEEAKPITVPEEWRHGTYVLVFDPLDGSSNVDANVSVGTIFGVYRRLDPEGEPSERDILQPGRDMVGAGYIIYGSSTVFVYSAGAGVHGFTLDPEIGEFLLSHPDIRCSERGRILSVNESYWEYWDESVHAYLDYSQEIDRETKRPYNRRYIGSLVADFHRNLMYGGVFLYPADTRDPRKPHGKLRLLYEAAPLAYVVEQAGGAASDGTGRILDIQPEELHQRTPLIIGNEANVEEAVGFIGR